MVVIVIVMCLITGLLWTKHGCPADPPLVSTTHDSVRGANHDLGDLLFFVNLVCL